MHPTHWLISTQVDGGIKATPETIGACAAAGANCFIAGSGLFAYDDMSQAVFGNQFYGTFLDAIDATPARWRGDAGSSPLDRARSAASSPRCTRHTG